MGSMNKWAAMIVSAIVGMIAGLLALKLLGQDTPL